MVDSRSVRFDPAFESGFATAHPALAIAVANAAVKRTFRNDRAPERGPPATDQIPMSGSSRRKVVSVVDVSLRRDARIFDTTFPIAAAARGRFRGRTRGA
jgi:hypothetical protein